MPDLDQIKQAEQGLRDRRGRFAKAWTPGAGCCEPRASRNDDLAVKRVWGSGAFTIATDHRRRAQSINRRTAGAGTI